uniref:Uncharacterized protein n=1 Tax=Anguilla anguilla TaxID=7936 RepID=A0A0E9TUX8_ANGAN
MNILHFLHHKPFEISKRMWSV